MRASLGNNGSSKRSLVRLCSILRKARRKYSVTFFCRQRSTSTGEPCVAGMEKIFRPQSGHSTEARTDSVSDQVHKRNTPLILCTVSHRKEVCAGKIVVTQSFEVQDIVVSICGANCPWCFIERIGNKKMGTGKNPIFRGLCKRCTAVSIPRDRSISLRVLFVPHPMTYSRCPNPRSDEDSRQASSGHLSEFSREAPAGARREGSFLARHTAWRRARAPPRPHEGCGPHGPWYSTCLPVLDTPD